MTFKPIQVKVTPNTPRLPDIVAFKYTTCGSIRIDRFPDRVSSDLSKRKVNVISKTSHDDVTELTVNADGSFCADLIPGEYVFRAVVSAHELHAGLLLQPAEHAVKVTDRPLSNVNFQQLRLRVSGRIQCLEKCKALRLSLTSAQRSDDKQIITATPAKANSAEFTFADVMPGQYHVAILSDDWCWQHMSVDVLVKDTDVTDVTFTHNGYVLSCSVSHDVTLEFVHDKNKQTAGSFDLSRGASKFCLEKPGVYNLHPRSCHQFEQDVYRFDTSAPSVLALHAVKHLVQGKISATVNETGIKIQVKSSHSDTPTQLGPLKPAATAAAAAAAGKQKALEYVFSLWAQAGESFEVTPLSESLLFYPPTRSLSVDGSECVGVALTFDGKQGLFISGSVTPPLADVAITITGSAAEVIVSTSTDSAGKYRVGPLHPDAQYDVTASREGYVFRQDGKGSFSARKLGEISVQVVDDSGAPLQSVLLSLSAVDYRNNVQTPANGTVSVLGLDPGQYFVKLMMKEYVFTPASQTVTVNEGGSVKLKVTGKRVAYSCHGRVTSLNGEPEPGLLVEAVGQGEKCEGLQEESKTESDGRFQLRGLQPGCRYQLQVKAGETSAHIERTAPLATTLDVQHADISDVHIIAFRRINRLDVSAHINCSQEFLPHLRLSVYQDSQHDSPVHTVQLAQTSFVYLPPLNIDQQKYHIKLESSLSKALYYYTLPEVSFVADTSFRHFTLSFEPVRKSVEQEMNHSSFLIVPFTLLLVVLAYHHQAILPFISSAVQSLYAAYSQRQSAQAPASHVTSTYEISPDLYASSGKRKKPKKV